MVRDSAGIDADAIKSHCRARLATYKVPRSIDFVATLPRTGSGKLQRHLLSPPSTSHAALNT